MTATNLLVTGLPGCGKSTLIEGVVTRIDRPTTGFFTREIREKGRRVGFAIETLDGAKGLLAHVNARSRLKVGKYHVILHDLEEIAVPSMIPKSPDEVIVIDEIGKMECLSNLFRETLQSTLDSPNRVIGSIALKGGGFIQAIKKRCDVEVIVLSPENRDGLNARLVHLLLSA